MLIFVNQFITGLLLSSVYVSGPYTAFTSIAYMMFDVNCGWVVRFLHVNGASFFLFFLYLHLIRGLFFRLNSN
jgi:ubiquinol-cytochrome c reductase cytochrome b subunit